MIKYEYETGLCKQLHYNGLWSVQYEGVPGHFQKVKMVCPCIKDGCDRDCEVFKSLPDIKAANQEWHMRDEIQDNECPADCIVELYYRERSEQQSLTKIRKEQ